MCSPDTCHLPRKQLSRTSVSGWTQARVSYGGMCPGRGQTSRTGADDCRPYRACAAPSVSTDIHGLQPSRPGRVAVPWRIASIGLHSEIIQHGKGRRRRGQRRGGPQFTFLATPLIGATANPGYQRLMVVKHYVELRYCSAVVRCGLSMHWLSAAIGI